MSAPSKRSLWIVLATLAAILLVAFVASRKWGKPPSPRLPAFDAAEVSLFDAASAPGTLVTTPLNPADVARLRTELEASKRDQNPQKWVVVGKIRLLHAGVEVQQISLFRGGAGLMPFGIGGEYYQPKPGGLMRDLLETSNLPRR